MTALLQALEGFSERANANPHVRKLARAWQTQLYIESVDAGDCFRLAIDDGVIRSVEPAAVPTHETLLLRGQDTLLTSMFRGSTHPLNAYNDGDLEIYGPQPDQIKLDAISLLIWGA